MIETMNHDAEEPDEPPYPDMYLDPRLDRCCDDHSLLCSVSDSGLDACCTRCPEWGDPIWH